MLMPQRFSRVSREQDRLMRNSNQIEAVRAELQERPAALGELLPDP